MQNIFTLNKTNIIQKSNHPNQQIIYVRSGIFGTLGEGIEKIHIKTIKPFSFTIQNGKVTSISNNDSLTCFGSDEKDSISIDFFKHIESSNGFYEEVMNTLCINEDDYLLKDNMSRYRMMHNLTILKAIDRAIKKEKFERIEGLLSKMR